MTRLWNWIRKIVRMLSTDEGGWALGPILLAIGATALLLYTAGEMYSGAQSVSRKIAERDQQFNAHGAAGVIPVPKPPEPEPAPPRTVVKERVIERPADPAPQGGVIILTPQGGTGHSDPNVHEGGESTGNSTSEGSSENNHPPEHEESPPGHDD